MAHETKIEGVKFIPKKIIPDERGNIMHGVRSDNILNDFGEVYFSKIYEGAVKAWHVHETLILNYMCIYGQVKIVLHDLREDSPSHGVTQEFFVGMDNHSLLHIPPGIANGTKSIWGPYSIVCNVASEPHNPDVKYRRIHPDEGIIDYNWDRPVF
jgi:dTDP-4-dehydrorhamnose 3,5-epimerase